MFTCLATEFVLRFTLDKKQDLSRVFSAAIIIDICGFIFLSILTPLIGSFINLGNYWLMFLVYYFTTTMTNILSQFVKGLEKIKIYSFSGVLNTTIVVIFNVIFLIVLKLGVIGYILAYIIGSMVTALFLIFKVKLWRYFRIITKKDLVEIRNYLKYSIPMIPNSINWWINNSLDKYMLTLFWGVSATGIYAAGYKIPSFLTIISSIFLSAWQISAVKDFGSEEGRKLFSNVYKKYSSLVIMTGGIIISLSYLISKILLSNEFFNAWKFAPILVYGYIFQTMSGFLGTIYTSSKKTSMLFVSTLVGAIINASLNMLLIPKYSSFGASVATAVSYIVIWLIRLIHSRKNIIKIDINIKRDVISYIILCMIVVLTIVNNYFTKIIALALMIIIVFLNRDGLSFIKTSIVAKINNKKEIIK